MFLCWFQGPTPQQYNVSDLNQRFGLELDLTNDAIQERLNEIQERIRKEILTEMKIKEGAENLRKVRVSGFGSIRDIRDVKWSISVSHKIAI